MKKINIYIKVLVLVLLTTYSCKKMDDSYKEFYEDGETVYVSKPDSLKAFVGKERIQLQWLLISDPKVKRYKIFWNNRADSLEGELVKTENVDTVKVLINSLPEGPYNFEVIQYDNFGNSSITSTIVGRSYSSLYSGTLYNKPLRSVVRDGADIKISWGAKDEDMQQVIINYVDANNVAKALTIPASDNETVLPDFSFSGEFSYKTTYAPDSLFVDTFPSIEETYKEVVSEVQSDKSTFAHLILPTDSYQPYYDTWSIRNLWDGISDQQDRFFYMADFIPNLTLPNWFTIDLGKSRLLTKVRVNQLAHNDAWLYAAGAPKQYEIYGSNDPSADGSFENWTLLGEYTSTRPSGQAYNTYEDIIAGRAGELRVFEGNTQTYRYIRFKTLQTWGVEKNVMISELTFFETGSVFTKITN